MAIIKQGQKFHSLDASVDTKERGSSLTNSKQEVYTIEDIVETVNAGGGGSLPYSSLFVKITQVGNATPSLNILSNDTDITFSNVFDSTGLISLVMSPGTYPDDGNMMIIPGGFNNGNGYGVSWGVPFGQQAIIRTAYYDETNQLVYTDLGFGGTNSMIVELRVFS